MRSKLTALAGRSAAMYALGPNQWLSSERPPLTVSVTPSTLTLNWPLASAGFLAQSRTNPVLGNWMNGASPAPQIIGAQWQVTLPSSTDGAAFYRLVK